MGLKLGIDLDLGLGLGSWWASGGVKKTGFLIVRGCGLIGFGSCRLGPMSSRASGSALMEFDERRGTQSGIHSTLFMLSEPSIFNASYGQ